MQKPALKYLTPEAYLAMEETAEVRHEYYQGEIFAMAGGSSNHNTIAGDVYTQMNLAFRDKGCIAYITDMRLWIKANGLFTYPDVMAVCGEPQFYENRNDTITNPVVIIEVLSKSTEEYNRVGKFKFYRSIPTLQEYVMIDQYSVHVEQYYLEAPNRWVLIEYNELSDILKFAKIDFKISLQDIYRRVTFAEHEERRA